MDRSKQFSLLEAAALLDVQPRLIRQWIKTGKFNGSQTGPKGSGGFNSEELFHLKKMRDAEAASVARKHPEARTDRMKDENLFMRRVIDNLFVFVGVLMPDGTLIEANRAPVAAAGLEMSDVIGKKFWDCHWWNYSKKVQRQLQQATRQALEGKAVRYDVPVRMAGDSLLWIDFQIAPLKDNQGTITHLIPSAMDISERKKAEKELEEKENNFRTLADNMAPMAWMADGKGRRFWFNQRWNEYTGITLEAAAGLGWKKAHHPDHVERVVRSLNLSFKRGRMWEDTFPLKAKDGKYRWFLTRAVPIKDSKGRVLRWFGTNTDVTELQQLQEALQRRENQNRLLADTYEMERNKLAAVINYLPIGVGIGDAEGNTLSLNKAGLKIHGFASEQEMFERLNHYGREFELRYPDGQLLPMEEWPASRAIKGTYVKDFQLWIKNRELNRERFVSYSVMPVRNKRSEVVLIVYMIKDLTEQRQTDEVLRRSEERFRQLANSMPQLVWTAEPDGKVDYYNEKYKNFSGIMKKGSRFVWEPVVHPHERKATENAWREATKKREIYEVEHRIKVRGGEYRWYLSRGIPIKDGDGQVLKWYGTATDIHEQKLVQQELEEITQRLLLAEEAGNTGSFDWDIPDDMVIWSDGMERNYGLEPGSFKGRYADWTKLVVPDDYQKAQEDLQLSFKTGQFNSEWRTVWPDGSTHYIYARAKVIFDGRGRPKRMLGVNMDISELKQLQEALKISESKLQRLFKANIVGIIYWNIAGKITEANDVFLESVGYTRQDLEQEKIDWIKMTPPEYKEVDRAAVAELESAGFHHPVEKEYERKDGKRVHVLVGSAYLDDKKTDGVGFVLNITRQKHLERLKDDFIGVAGHELKTPVTSLKAYTQVLKTLFGRKGDTGSVAYLQKMELQIDKLTTLISDLLDITRVQTGKLELRLNEFDVNQLVQEVAEQMQLTTTKHEIQVTLARNTRIKADRDRISQVLTNLLSNAIKYSPDSKRIIVSTKATGKAVSVCVRDYGMGIPRAKQAFIFQRFYRVDGRKPELFPGIGLGLYISAEIIKRHFGKIWFESEAGKGATFCFQVPCLARKNKGKE